nr:MAG TPA: hypothetical protein [Caudoviricetes sp.]
MLHILGIVFMVCIALVVIDVIFAIIESLFDL